MIVYGVTDANEHGETKWFASKREAIQTCKRINRAYAKEGASPNSEVFSAEIGNPTRKRVLSYLNGENFIRRRATVYPPVESAP